MLLELLDAENRAHDVACMIRAHAQHEQRLKLLETPAASAAPPAPQVAQPRQSRLGQLGLAARAWLCARPRLRATGLLTGGGKACQFPSPS